MDGSLLTWLMLITNIDKCRYRLTSTAGLMFSSNVNTSSVHLNWPKMFTVHEHFWPAVYIYIKMLSIIRYLTLQVKMAFIVSCSLQQGSQYCLPACRKGRSVVEKVKVSGEQTYCFVILNHISPRRWMNEYRIIWHNLNESWRLSPQWKPAMNE